MDNITTEAALPKVGRADYHERREARIERLEERVNKTMQKADDRFATAHQIGSYIPFGQPILVGHHSEGRHRRDLDKIDTNMRKGCDLLEKAKKQKWAAEGAAKNNAISSDNPDALNLLRLKLADAESDHKHLADTRKAWQMLQRGTLEKNKTISDDIKEAVIAFVPGTEYFSREPVLAYELQNSNANIKTIKDRIANLEKMAEPAQPDRQIEDITIIDSKTLNRVQIVFPGKPDDATRLLLKRNGFKWAPSQGAWQRLRTPGVFTRAVWLISVQKAG